jgi:RNA 3'-phosphate cyclase
MIEIDGSRAGGQLLRTATALSALTEKPFRITNIRGARPEPGIKAQHLEGIKAIAELCNAKVKGLEINSKELEFYPNKLEEKDLEIKISTAGSIGLVLQALLILTPHIKKDIKIKFEGGATWGKWAPPVVYLERVLFSLLNYDCELEIIKEGFYPRGAAVVEAILKPMKIKPIKFTERKEIKSVNIISVASSFFEKAKVAERQAEAAQKLLEEKLNKTPFIEIKYSEAISPGSGILAMMRTENSFIGADLIGEKGKPAEYIGERTVRDLIKEYSKGVIDRHAADMLLPYMTKNSKIITSDITHHIMTSSEVIEKFLDIEFKIDKEEKTISCFSH